MNAVSLQPELLVKAQVSLIASNILLVVASTIIIVGGVIPFIFQYEEIRKRQTAKGFSLFVCLTLLLANILRILFWCGKRFELQLLAQSIVMIICMLFLVRLAVQTNQKHILPPRKHISLWEGHLLSHFWAWTDFGSYIATLAMFAAFASLLTAAFLQSWLFVEALGFVSLFAEANLGSGQLVRNWKRRSTVGMSVRMVVLWTLGDIGKTVYFIVRRTPAQFYLCGFYQISIDLLILGQVLVYRHESAEL